MNRSRNYPPLNDAQRALAESAYNTAKALAHIMASKWGHLVEVDEIEGWALEGACRAAQSWQPERGPFDAHVWCVMEFFVIDQVRVHTHKRIRTPAVHTVESLEDQVLADGTFDDATVAGPDAVDRHLDMLATLDVVRDVMLGMGGRDTAIVRDTFAKPLAEVGVDWGLTEARICQIRGAFRGRVRAALQRADAA